MAPPPAARTIGARLSTGVFLAAVLEALGAALPLTAFFVPLPAPLVAPRIPPTIAPSLSAVASVSAAFAGPVFLRRGMSLIPSRYPLAARIYAAAVAGAGIDLLEI